MHRDQARIRLSLGLLALAVAGITSSPTWAMSSMSAAAAGTSGPPQTGAASAAPAPAGPPDDHATSTAAGVDQQLGEVLVTARKRVERLIDVPESIAAITADALHAKGITTVEDLGRQTPNLQLNMRQDLTTDVVIRGVGAYGDVLGVGFSIDDVPNFTDQTMPLQDLERVEIMKGPQGTLYGGSSIGGLVRYVSKKPTFDWQGEASGEVGSHSEINVFAAQNIPIIADKLAVRLSGYDMKGDGYLTNSALGIDGSPVKQHGLRAMLLYMGDDAFQALLTLRYAYMRNGADEYVPVPSVTDYTYDVPLFQPTSNSRSVYGVVLELTDELGPTTLTSISSFTSAQYELNADISQSPPNVPGQSMYTVPGNRPAQVATQELRLNSRSGGNFEWLSGLYGAVIKDILLNKVGVSSYPPPADPQIINDFNTKRTDLAAFGTTTYHLGPVRLEGGLRLMQTQFHAFVYVEAGGLPNQGASTTTHAVLPKASISYALPSGGQIYASVTKGEEPGAVNTVSVAPLPYKPETALSYELGVKGLAAGHRLEYELSTFYVNNNNHQVQTNQFIASEGGMVTLINNIGDSRTYGLESSLNWSPIQGLRLGLDGGYLNAKWKKAAVFGQAIDGYTIPNAPSVTASASVSYLRPVGRALELETTLDTSYTNAMWWDLPNTPGSKEPPHWIGNFRLALGSESRGWQVAFRVSNLFNARYWTEYFPGFFPAGSLPCAGCANIGAIGAPRQFFASVDYKY